MLEKKWLGVAVDAYQRPRRLESYFILEQPLLAVNWS